MNRIRLIIFIGGCSIIFFIFFYFLFINRCAGEEEVYKLEVKGTLVSKYFYKATHLRIYTGKDTTEPFGTYSQELIESLQIGDSLFKPSYNDTCYIFKNHGAIFKVIYNYSNCPCDKQKNIRAEINELRKNN